jgi:hypothetical protein
MLKGREEPSGLNSDIIDRGWEFLSSTRLLSAWMLAYLKERVRTLGGMFQDCHLAGEAENYLDIDMPTQQKVYTDIWQRENGRHFDQCTGKPGFWKIHIIVWP